MGQLLHTNARTTKSVRRAIRLCKDLICDDPLFVLTEAGGIRSGWFNDIKPAFGLSGSKIEEKILFGKELEPRNYYAKL